MDSILFTIFCGIIFHYVTKQVNYPFIDEIFHLRQCQTYCDGNFSHWDDKITTPPGLYWLGLGYVKVLESITSVPLMDLCGRYDVLRSVNVLGGIFVLPLSLFFIKKGGIDQFWSINIISLPLLFTYYFLFYTDTWSLVLTVGALGFIVYRPLNSTFAGLFAGLLAFASLFFRQTNIIWNAFLVSVYVAREMETDSTSVVDYIFTYIKTGVRNLPGLLTFIAGFISFAVFIVINEGITFGDKQNHQVSFHLVQVFYCLLFINFFTWPVWLSVERVKKYMRFCFSGFNGLWLIISLTGIKFIIDNFTIVHPFLLADNRHFTFYLWRRLLSLPYSNVFMTPIYHFCSWNVINNLLSTSSKLKLTPLTVTSFFIALCLTLIPSPLFEPRYYITPLVMFRLFTSPTTNSRHIIEFIWLNAINVVTMVIFFKYEFYWDSEPGIIQRIIW